MTQPTKRARKKDLTGVNLAAIHKRLRKIEEMLKYLDTQIYMMRHNIRIEKAKK